ncbi:hypothetical protein Nepgr_013764 [Nepenthes gracilis]|uniref:Sas10 C-terminal domain-containing protein n=1 Tax=Nepenthes gracilis TaxID=150966 RepID=A0AAD3XP96_NEPGR|nr:hypothetical protein Nepgr_013764 [Nepenthes gracilis]
MGKRGKNQKTGSRNPKKMKFSKDLDLDNMDDEIDAFHKQRDVIPLDINEDVGESDEDNEHPVFDYEDIHDDEDDDEDDAKLGGLVAKISRTQKYLKAKFGDAEDEMHDDAGDEEERRTGWGWGKKFYYDGDNVDYELQSSDEEDPALEEAEAINFQQERAKSLTMADFQIENIEKDDSDMEPTVEEMLVKGKDTSRISENKETRDDKGTTYEEVEKDLSALSRNELMDVVSSSAPELVVLLSELNDAFEQLDEVNPLLSKKENIKKEGMHYLEVKRLLLLTYCQAITFYLLLKSEGQPVRDHPVIARLVVIQSLLDQMKELDVNLPCGLAEILNENDGIATAADYAAENAAVLSDDPEDNDLMRPLAEKQAAPKFGEAAEPVKMDISKGYEKKLDNSMCQNEVVCLESVRMLKVRETLEEKLKKKGIFTFTQLESFGAKTHKLKPVNGQLETLDDFDDDTMDVEGTAGPLRNGQGLRLSNKLSQLITTKSDMSRVASGDDDLPKRDDLGERRRKHELRVLAGAGIESIDDDVENYPGNCGGGGDAEADSGGTGESEDEFYKQVKLQRAEKLAAKSEKYSRKPSIPSYPDTILDGKRQITTQMEKNRGLTRSRKKLTKNPRKKYRRKHDQTVKRRQGQVREIRRPTGPYGGEASGINARISRSIRFKG